MRVAVPLIAAVLITGRTWAQCPDGTPPPCAARQLRAVTPQTNSVAVLYFENLGRDSADTYIADGLTEEVTARLGQVSRLAVTSRTSVRRVRNVAEVSTIELGRLLNASYLVSGSVRRAGERLRVTVELVRASSGARVWGDQYDRGTTDLLGIQEDIARNVAIGIAGRLLPAESRVIATRPTRSPEAYDHYLRATALLKVVSPTTLPRIIDEVDAALRLDGRYAGALAVQSVAYTLAVNWSLSTAELPLDSMLARAVAASDAALRADSSSADAWWARGALLCFRYPRDCATGSEAAFQRSIALDSTIAAAHWWYSTWLRRLGRFDAALAESHRTLALDPTVAQVISDIGFIFYQKRRFAEAVSWFDSANRVAPQAWHLRHISSRARLETGDTAGARRDADLAVAFAGTAADLARIARVQVLARLGDSTGARAELADALPRFERPDSVNVRDGYELALSLLAVGRRDDALVMLERTRPRGAWLWSYLWFPGFDAVRHDPRFQRVYQECRPPGAPDPPGT